MKKSLAIACLISAALFACGGKNKSGTSTPQNKTGTTAPMKGATGGAGYGGAAYGGPSNPPNPCAGGI
jgi:hypothetical protein